MTQYFYNNFACCSELLWISVAYKFARRISFTLSSSSLRNTGISIAFQRILGNIWHDFFVSKLYWTQCVQESPIQLVLFICSLFTHIILSMEIHGIPYERSMIFQWVIMSTNVHMPLVSNNVYFCCINLLINLTGRRRRRK